MGVPKYTYEEYKKIKAMSKQNEDDDSKSGQEINHNESGDDLGSYYDDLNSYNQYIKDFTLIYNEYSGLILPLIDSFDSEQQDLDKKNEYAKSIKQHISEWIEELEGLDTPLFMMAYQGYVLEYLEKEILFYSNFLLGESGLANKYQNEANQAYEKSKEELKNIEQDFKNRAQKLGIDTPF